MSISASGPERRTYHAQCATAKSAIDTSAPKKIRPAVLQLRFESRQLARQIGAGIERALTLRSGGKWFTVGGKGQRHRGLGLLKDVRRACGLKAGISRPFSENGALS